MACGTITRIAVAIPEAMKATSIPSATTQTWGFSVADSCWASPRFRPSVAICAANSTISTA